MGVAHSRGNTAVRNDPSNNQMVDPGLVQNPLQAAHIEGGERHLLDLDIAGCQPVDDILTETAGAKSPLPKKRTKLLQVWRDERLSTLAGNQREMGRDDPAALRASGLKRASAFLAGPRSRLLWHRRGHRHQPDAESRFAYRPIAAPSCRIEFPAHPLSSQ